MKTNELNLYYQNKDSKEYFPPHRLKISDIEIYCDPKKNLLKDSKLVYYTPAEIKYPNHITVHTDTKNLGTILTQDKLGRIYVAGSVNIEELIYFKNQEPLREITTFTDLLNRKFELIDVTQGIFKCANIDGLIQVPPDYLQKIIYSRCDYLPWSDSIGQVDHYVMVIAQSHRNIGGYGISCGYRMSAQIIDNIDEAKHLPEEYLKIVHNIKTPSILTTIKRTEPVIEVIDEQYLQKIQDKNKEGNLDSDLLELVKPQMVDLITLDTPLHGQIMSEFHE